MDGFDIINKSAKSLSDDELMLATKDLYINKYSKQYPRENRRLVDPIKHGEPRFVLFSYIKSPLAKPDPDGLFGAAKIRGVFFTEEDAAKRAAEIIKDVDSVNSIYTCLVGQAFPLIVDGNVGKAGSSGELSEIDIRENVDNVIAANVREKRNTDQKTMDEMKQRQEDLMKDVDPNKELDPLDSYVQDRVKLAHLRYHLFEYTKHVQKCTISERNALERIKSLLIEHPEYEDQYMEKYKQGRRTANIPENTDVTGLMKFMADPLYSLNETVNETVN